MIGHNLCSPAILEEVNYLSKEGQHLTLSCDVNDRFLVNGVPVRDVDTVSDNGVIHVLDTLLVPDSVKAVADLLLEMDLGQFQEYAQQAGLGDILSGERPGNFTFFVPNADAFRRECCSFVRSLAASATAVDTVLNHSCHRFQSYHYLILKRS